MFRAFIASLAAAASIAAPGFARAEPPAPDTLVRTTSGLVQGVVEGDLRAFRGIPYAAPPIGSLRWQPPAPAPAWSGIRDASEFGAVCPQPNASGGVRGDEDCLTLNVFTASTRGASKMPVMVFVHGGGNKRGSARAPQFDSPPLALHGVVVVTLQYRLGALGFMGHAALTAEGGGSSGNYALMDQIAALQWVRDNISAFGGDKDRVMVFGQSAGAYDVNALLASPPAQGLFSRAGIESGAALPNQTQELDEAQAASAPLVSAVGCEGSADVLACLRSVPAEDIVKNQGDVPALLTIEPRALPVEPLSVLATRGTPVPLLIGSNREESTTLVDDPDMLLDADGYAARIHAEFDPLGAGVADRVLTLYPVGAYDSPVYALVAVHSDFFETCQVRTAALAATGKQVHPVYRYLFTHRLQNDSALNAARAFHGEELYFVFGNLHAILGTDYAMSPGELLLSERIMNFWANFAAHGNPNGSGPGAWRRYDARGEAMLQLDERLAPLAGYHIPQCDFLSGLPQP